MRSVAIIFSLILLLSAGNNIARTINDRAILFVENKGQWGTEARFKTDVEGGAVFLTDNGLMYHFVHPEDRNNVHHLTHDSTGYARTGYDLSKTIIRHHAYSVSFEGAQKPSSCITAGKKDFYHNYFFGNNPDNWAGKAGIYTQLTQKNIYNDIDFFIYSTEGALKYDFILAPNADPANIRLRFDGAKPRILENGSLCITTSVNEVIEKAPYAYQQIHDKQVAIPCFYKLSGSIISFEFPAGYNRNYPLIIDPTLIFSTFSGSVGDDFLCFASTYDHAGNFYAGSKNDGIGWPVTTGSFQTSAIESVCVGINKYNATGTTLLYSTYYAGTNSNYVNAMIVNSRNELIISGYTNSQDLPVTPGCYDPSFSGRNHDLYMAHFSVDGSSLIGATYIGGTDDEAHDRDISDSLDPSSLSPVELAIDASDNIWIASSTSSKDFPITANAFQPQNNGGMDGIIFQLNPDGTRLRYGSYLGGARHDRCFNIRINKAGNLVVCGATSSKDFPTTQGVLHPQFMGGISDGFATIIDSSAGNIIASTYIGTADRDGASRVQTDEADNIYILGQTRGNYPISANVFHLTETDLFIDKLTPDLSSSIFSSRIGNAQSQQKQLVPSAFLVDTCNNIYISGFEANNGLPVSADAFATGNRSFWFGVFEPEFTDLLFGTYFGVLPIDHTHEGIHRFDPNGIIYQGVCSLSPIFPTTPDAAFPMKQNVGVDNLSFKIDMGVRSVISGFELAHGYNDTGCAPYSITFNNTSHIAKEYIWNFGDGSPVSNDTNATHTYTAPGIYRVTLHARNNKACITDDTSEMQITIFSVPVPEISTLDTTFCTLPRVLDIAVFINNPSPTQKIKWQGNGILGNDEQQHITVAPSVNTTYIVTVSDAAQGICSTAASDTVQIHLIPDNFGRATNDTGYCLPGFAQLRAEGGEHYLWTPSYGLDDTSIATPIASPINTTKYTVYITEQHGCKDTLSVTVAVYPSATIQLPDTIFIYPGEAYQLDPATNCLYGSWFPAYGLSNMNIINPELTPEVDTRYFIRATTEHGCTIEDSVTALVAETVIAMPNAFRPGNGNNPVLKPTIRGIVVLKSFSIYNRWGNQLFSTSDITKGWDGHWNGELQPMGVYVYRIEGFTEKGKRFYKQGNVTLIR